MSQILRLVRLAPGIQERIELERAAPLALEDQVLRKIATIPGHQAQVDAFDNTMEVLRRKAQGLQHHFERARFSPPGPRRDTPAPTPTRIPTMAAPHSKQGGRGSDPSSPEVQAQFDAALRAGAFHQPKTMEMLVARLVKSRKYDLALELLELARADPRLQRQWKAINALREGLLDTKIERD